MAELRGLRTEGDIRSRLRGMRLLAAQGQTGVGMSCVFSIVVPLGRDSEAALIDGRRHTGQCTVRSWRSVFSVSLAWSTIASWFGFMLGAYGSIAMVRTGLVIEDFAGPTGATYLRALFFVYMPSGAGGLLGMMTSWLQIAYSVQ